MALHKIREELQKKQDSIDPRHSDEFYSILKFKPEFRKGIINTRRLLNEFYEMCQILRDMINIGEETDWNLRTSVQSIYRSIGTYINRLDDENDENAALIRRLLAESYAASSSPTTTKPSRSPPKVLNIYEVSRPNESFAFNRNNLENVRLLFHGSRANNFVGILSRGLILPKFVANASNDELQRTDQG